MGRKPEGSAESAFKKLGKKIDELILELKATSGNVNDDLKERWEELKKSRDTVKEEFKDFKGRNQKIWDEIDRGFEKAGEDFKKAGSEIKNAFDSAFRNKK